MRKILRKASNKISYLSKCPIVYLSLSRLNYEEIGAILLPEKCFQEKKTSLYKQNTFFNLHYS